MVRKLLLTALVALLLLAPARAHAGDIESPERLVHIHDLTDLTGRVPELVKELSSIVQDADLTEAQPGVVIVRARGRVQDDLALILAGLRRDLGAAKPGEDAAEVAKRILAAARDNARTLERLRGGRVTWQFVGVSGLDVLEMLSVSLGLNLIVSPEAGQQLKTQQLTLDLRDVTLRVALDMVLEPSGLRLTVDQGIVRILASRELDPGRFHLGFAEAIVPTEAEWVEASKGGNAAEEAGTDEADDLTALVRALREEVRALREEVREVRSILEEIRDR